MCGNFLSSELKMQKLSNMDPYKLQLHVEGVIQRLFYLYNTEAFLVLGLMMMNSKVHILANESNPFFFVGIYSLLYCKSNQSVQVQR